MDTLDQQAILLAKAIRQSESGGNFNAKGKSGELGAYQYTEPTWQKDSSEAGVNVPLKNATPEQQNQVAYTRIKKWKDAGYNPGQIASMWNAGEKEPNAYLGTFSDGTPAKGRNSYGADYDVPKYAQSVATAYHTLKGGGAVTADPNNPSSIAAPQQPQQDNSGAWFPASASDTGAIAGAKALGNIIPSTYGLAKGLGSALIHPIQTVKTLGMGAVGLEQNLIEKVLNLQGAPTPSQEVANAIGHAIKERYGSLEAAQRTATNDPMGFGADILGVVAGGEALAVKGAKLADIAAGTGRGAVAAENAASYLNRGINVMPQAGKMEGLVRGGTESLNKNVQNIATPMANAVGAPARVLGKAGLSTISHITGLEPETITTIFKNPSAFSKTAIDEGSRNKLVAELSDAIDQKITELGEEGRVYDVFRQTSAPITVPRSEYIRELANKGIKASFGSDGWKLSVSSESVPVSKADLGAIKEFLNQYATSDTHTGNSLLNARQKLAQLAKYEVASGKTSEGMKIAQSFREGILNKVARPQVQGLQEADTRYGSVVNDLERIKDDFIVRKTGELKQGAMTKLANAGNKPALLSRVEKLMPGITEKLKNLRAAEDVARATGNKVGTYGQAIAGGLGLGTLAGIGGPIGPAAIVYLLATNPPIAVQVLRALGYPQAKIAEIIKSISPAANAEGIRLTPEIKAMIRGEAPVINAPRK